VASSDAGFGLAFSVARQAVSQSSVPAPMEYNAYTNLSINLLMFFKQGKGILHFT